MRMLKLAQNEWLILMVVMILLCQNLILNEVVSLFSLITISIFTLLGLALGLFGNSILIATFSMLIVSVGTYIMYYVPIILPTFEKNYFIIIMPVFAIVGFFLKSCLLYNRRYIKLKPKMKQHLSTLDEVTSLYNKQEFEKRYSIYLETMHLHKKCERKLVVSLYIVDYLEQYMYQNNKSLDQLLLKVTEQLLTIRLPEEEIYYLDDGVFAVISPIYQSDYSENFIKRLNEVTKIQLGLIPFKIENQLQDTVIRFGEVVIEQDSSLTSEQVISRMKRRAEVDIQEEYII